MERKSSTTLEKSMEGFWAMSPHKPYASEQRENDSHENTVPRPSSETLKEVLSFESGAQSLSDNVGIEPKKKGIFPMLRMGGSQISDHHAKQNQAKPNFKKYAPKKAPKPLANVKPLEFSFRSRNTSNGQLANETNEKNCTQIPDASFRTFLDRSTYRQSATDTALWCFQKRVDLCDEDTKKNTTPEIPQIAEVACSSRDTSQDVDQEDSNSSNETVSPKQTVNRKEKKSTAKVKKGKITEAVANRKRNVPKKPSEEKSKSKSQKNVKGTQIRDKKEPTISVSKRSQKRKPKTETSDDETTDTPSEEDSSSSESESHYETSSCESTPPKKSKKSNQKKKCENSNKKKSENSNKMKNENTNKKKSESTSKKKSENADKKKSRPNAESSKKKPEKENVAVPEQTKQPTCAEQLLRGCPSFSFASDATLSARDVAAMYNVDHVLFRYGPIRITGKELDILRHSSAYANDTLLDFYLRFLSQVMPNPRVRTFHAQFYNALRGAAQLPCAGDPGGRWGRSVRFSLDRAPILRCELESCIFLDDLWFVPVCHEEHWFLVLIQNPAAALSRVTPAHASQRIQAKGGSPLSKTDRNAAMQRIYDIRLTSMEKTKAERTVPKAWDFNSVDEDIFVPSCQKPNISSTKLYTNMGLPKSNDARVNEKNDGHIDVDDSSPRQSRATERVVASTTDATLRTDEAERTKCSDSSPSDSPISTRIPQIEFEPENPVLNESTTAFGINTDTLQMGNYLQTKVIFANSLIRHGDEEIYQSILIHLFWFMVTRWHVELCIALKDSSVLSPTELIAMYRSLRCTEVVPVSELALPQQPLWSADCGFFLLHYTEILRHPSIRAEQLQSLLDQAIPITFPTKTVPSPVDDSAEGAVEHKRANRRARLNSTTVLLFHSTEASSRKRRYISALIRTLVGACWQRGRDASGRNTHECTPFRILVKVNDLQEEATRTLSDLSKQLSNES